MEIAILFGIGLISLGGLVSASYYTPIYRIKDWAWITSWITLLFFAWIVLPVTAALLVTKGHFFSIMASCPLFCVLMTLLFGVLRGSGGLMNGLSLRFLGISLANSICIGVCAIFGTLVPPLIEGKFVEYFSKPSGWIVIGGLVICVLGTSLCGLAGMMKEEAMSKNENANSKQDNTETTSVSQKEFAFGKGILIAIGGGIMSACMAIAIKYGKPIDEASVVAGTQEVFKSVPALVLSMGGGYITNLIYAFIVASKNRSFGDFVMKDKGRLLANMFWAFLSGLMVYGQYFLYVMGSTKLGKLEFASWTIFMTAIILFGALWGLILREWKGSNAKTLLCLWSGIAILLLSICIIYIGPTFVAD
ncbi:MAG: L-rhamnose/proton symporter RhaT [Thermoguttaceae bacterium]|nr:L-rhamnose/proton symporter RhaT [Thermoguttaceae bacterium]